MKIDSVIAKIYTEIYEETGISASTINKCMKAYYKGIGDIMKHTAQGRISMTKFGKLIFNEAWATRNAEKNVLLSRGVRNKIEQHPKSKKPISIYELVGIRRRNETT